jgi:mono/diheme cytochrome c family protein
MGFPHASHDDVPSATAGRLAAREPLWGGSVCKAIGAVQRVEAVSCRDLCVVTLLPDRGSTDMIHRVRPFLTLALASLALACGDDGGPSPADGTSSSTNDTTPSSSGPSTSVGTTTSVSTSDASTTQPDTSSSSGAGSSTGEPPIVEPCDENDGQCIFRFDTFGDEQLWTDVLRLHELVQTLPPVMALGVGLKVDAEAVPPDVLAAADLEDPATTVALLELDAVVGVMATVEDGTVTRIGITCALCHSTVDDSVAPGIGARLDGWPNRDLDPGAIIALTPGVATYAKSLGVDPKMAVDALTSWGPGRYDARFNQDLMSAPVLLPPAYGLADVELETYTGDGPISYWNAYVAVTQMGAHGDFVDEELGISIMHDPDLVTPKLPALRDYQFSLEAPEPPEGSFDAEAAARGQLLFEGDAQCSTCHTGAAFSDAPMLHTAEEVGMDPTEASRSKSGMYRTTPLRGAWQHPPYFHDGSAATFEDVVDHYDALLSLELTVEERSDLAAYLASL